MMMNEMPFDSGWEKIKGKGVAKLSRESHGLAWESTPSYGRRNCGRSSMRLSQSVLAEIQASIEKLKSEFDAA
jgi:hypothetical protein